MVEPKELKELRELMEIKELLQVIASNQEQENKNKGSSYFQWWLKYWKPFIPVFILGFFVGCMLSPLIRELWIWLIT